MKKTIPLIGCFLLFFISSFSQQGRSEGVQGQDKLSGKDVEVTYLADPGPPLELAITDDQADDIASEGEVRAVYSGGNEFKYPFHLDNGCSQAWEFGPEEKLEKITIALHEGSVLINHGNRLKKEVKREVPS
ncbi:MAG: hypothetical protein ABIN58_00565 [candidate division WOR-3 bacterium]